jgi:hypothetical protein
VLDVDVMKLEEQQARIAACVEMIEARLDCIQEAVRARNVLTISIPASR